MMKIGLRGHSGEGFRCGRCRVNRRDERYAVHFLMQFQMFDQIQSDFSDEITN